MTDGFVREPVFAGPAPGALGQSPLDIPALTVHLPPDELATGAAIIVAPGGGYRSLASDHEGLQVAQWLTAIGVVAFVLRYRLGPTYHSSLSLLDGQRAIRYVRQASKRFRINPQHIGFLGFSAGGHLACATAVQPSEGNPEAVDAVERLSARPDFVVAAYAVTNGAVRGRKANEYTPTDTKVTPQTPPTFLMHTHEDSIVPANQSTLFYNALLAAGVPAELHIFNHGDHSLGLMPGDSDTAHWTGLLQRWLRRRKLLTQKPRCAVVGRLLIDGVAPAKAWLTLLPHDVNAPLARIFLAVSSDGKFLISEDEGPVAGLHLLKVLEVSEQHSYDGTGLFSLPQTRVYECECNVVAGEEIILNLRKDQFLQGET